MMIETRTRILGIAPYEGMRAAMERAAQAYPEIQVDVYTGDLEEGVAIVQRMPANAYDCVISRGGTAELIRQVTELPVIEIQLSVYDVLSAMKLAENYSSRYAIVGFSGITEPAHTLCDLLGYHLDIITVHSADEVRRRLEQLRQNGYRMVVCDMVTHTIARQMDLDAFLITSGIDSIQAALEQALHISQWFRCLQQENRFLRTVTQDQNGRVVVLDSGGAVFYSSPTEPPAGLAEILQAHLREVPARGSMKFYYTERDQLYRITAQKLLIDTEKYCLFYCVPSRIPLHTHWTGLRTMNRGECEYLFVNSFYSISGAMGTMDAEIQNLAAARQPVMILGEQGTGKEQIARFLYLHGPLANKPFVLVNCELMNDKSWDFLLGHYNSPLNATGNTIYFQNFESLPEARAPQLLAAISETGLARRVRLLFSCVSSDSEPVSEFIRRFSARIGCLLLELPSLRSRSDEIPSLASLYLGSLNHEMGRQISGFEPHAMELLRQYDWPNNYTQFKHVLQTLAAQTNSAYIRGSMVAELLDRERRQRRGASLAVSNAAADTNRTLEEIVADVIQQTVAANNGNRAAAARQLGISRTTLWRCMRKNLDLYPEERKKQE